MTHIHYIQTATEAQRGQFTHLRTWALSEGGRNRSGIVQCSCKPTKQLEIFPVFVGVLQPYWTFYIYSAICSNSSNLGVAPLTVPYQLEVRNKLQCVLVLDGPRVT